METRICKECKVEKPLDKDHYQFRSDSGKYRPECKVCQKEYNSLYREVFKNEIYTQRHDYYDNRGGKEKHKDYYDNNQDEILEKAKATTANPEVKVKRRIRDKERNSRPETKAKANQRLKDKKKNDPSFRLRKYISDQIYRALKKQGSSKKGESITNHLVNAAYITALIAHIERLFSHPDNLTSDGKVWMTWNNQGVYRYDEWYDNDPTTWRWQLDHIKPQSEFPIYEIDHSNVMDCWALSNLRPLSAKQNIIDGVRKTRHSK